MRRKSTLSPTMTVTEFDHGYWYALELKRFAVSIGIPSASKLRKDQLEKTLRHFLQTGKIMRSRRRESSAPTIRDVDRGLDLDLPVAAYTNDKATKEFLEREARKLAPGYKRKSGARYRLNRWREDQLFKGRDITYRDLVMEYVRLSQPTRSFARIPHGRYINFLSDFLAKEKGATREKAIKAWKELKALDTPKDYHSWVRHRSSKQGKRGGA